MAKLALSQLFQYSQRFDGELIPDVLNDVSTICSAWNNLTNIMTNTLLLSELFLELGGGSTWDQF